jgi:hypothetical protein
MGEPEIEQPEPDEEPTPEEPSSDAIDVADCAVDDDFAKFFNRRTHAQSNQGRRTREVKTKS